MNLQLRLSLPVLTGILLSLVFLHFVIMPDQVEKSRQATHHKTLEILSASQPLIVRNLLEHDVASVYAIMESLEKFYAKRWHNLTLTDNNDRMIYPLLQRDNASSLPIDLIPIEFPLSIEGTQVGNIFLVIDWSVDKAQSIQNFQQLEIMLLVIFSIILLISIITQHRQIIMPLEKLRKAAGAISLGKYNTDLSHIRLDEVGKLNEAFITMRSRIQQFHEEMLEARRAAESSLKIKNEFLANMSHEIRTPLNAIIGMTHLALETELDKSQHNFIYKANHAAESLRRIVNDLLDFSKIEANKVELERENFMLEDILENLASLFGLASESKHLDILFDVGPNVPTALNGDQLRLSQILVNLCNNAIKFTPAGGIIRVEVKLLSADDYHVKLQFSVADNGIGMNADELQRLFRPFEQADTSTTRKYGGTGLGLAISKRLTEIMGGSIWVESEKDKGSTFYFSVLFEKQENQPRYHEVASHLGALNILIIDSNPAWLDFFRKQLTSLGFKPFFADTPDQALKQLKQCSLEKKPVSLVMLDSHIPDIDFVNFLQTLKSGKDLLKTPATILLTGHKTDELRTKLENKQLLDGVLSKPVTLNTMLDTIIFSLAGQSTVERFTSRQSVSQQAIQQLQHARVLLVEDNEVNQELVQELLANNGIHVVLAANGQEALDLVEYEAFDGILMDCQMPVMDGYTATRLIREKPQFAELPILAMTANVLLSDKQKAVAAGMNDHIDKPIHVEQMFKTMSKWIRPKPLTGQASAVQSVTNTPAMPTQPFADNQQPPESTTESLKGLKLEGIDLERGLHTTMKNESLYRKLLKRFADSEADFAERFAENLSVSITDARRVAHTLKGTAGNLGMKDLQAAAAELEKNCSEQSVNEIAGSMNQVEKQLTIVMHALQAFQGKNPPDNSSTAVDGNNLGALLQELHELVANDNIDADKVLEQITSQLVDNNLKDQLQRIEKAVGIYDFESALAEIESLIKKVQA